MITNTLVLKFRVAAILLIAAGYGWAGGHFVPADAPFYFYFFQFAVLLILLVLSLGFFRGYAAEGQAKPHAKWAVTGLSIFSAVTLVINIANIVRGFGNNVNNSFGSHNTLADIVPISIIMAGDIIWLMALVFAIRAARANLA